MAGADSLHLDKGFCVVCGVAGDAYGEVVAAVLTLDANLVGDPPYGRVIESEYLDDALEHVDEIVVAADVCQLMCEEGFQLLRRKSDYGAGWEEYNRAKPADYGGYLHEGRFHELDGAGDSESLG